jgi:hypothetical protein
MAKVTWLGEDHLHKDQNGPRFTIWNGVRFDKDKPVEVTHPVAIAKAQGNPFFKVEHEATKDIKKAVEDVVQDVKHGRR